MDNTKSGQNNTAEIMDDGDSEIVAPISLPRRSREPSPVVEQFSSDSERFPVDFKDALRSLIYNLHQYEPFVYAAILIVSLALCNFNDSTKTFDASSIRSIKDKYPGQERKLWVAIESGVQDVLEFNRPSTFVLLYKPQSEQIAEDILQDLSRYMLHKLGSPNEDPIVLTSKDLNSPPFTIDYGEVVGKYGEELRTKKVLIVKNLDEVQGKVAQAFHSLCDEYTPFVEHAVIVFTIKVDEFPERDNSYLEDLLKQSWNNLDEDIFDPLITRITGMILKIHPQISEKTEASSYFNFVQILWAPLLITSVLMACLRLLLSQYEDILNILDTHAGLNKSFWKSLDEITTEDQIFLNNLSTSFKCRVAEYLQKQLKISEILNVKSTNLHFIETFFERLNGLNDNNQPILNDCILLIEEIEDIHEDLYALYLTNKNSLNKIVKNEKFLIIYSIEDPKLHGEPLESFLSEEFLSLVPCKKTIPAKELL